MMPEWISKFFSVKLATLVLALYFIREVPCDADVKVTAMAVVSVVFIMFKTIQNIKLGDKEETPSTSSATPT